jgi:hypothetical protein
MRNGFRVLHSRFAVAHGRLLHPLLLRVGGDQRDYPLAGLQLDVWSGGTNLAALGDRRDNAAGRPGDIADALPARGESLWIRSSIMR